VVSLTGRVVQPESNVGDWEAVYLEHSLRLVRLATVLVGPDEAPDLVSDAVRRAVHSPGWASVRDHGGYLVTALVNQTRQFHRERARRAAREQRAARLVPPTGDGAVPPADLDVRRALQALSPQQRAITYLVYWEDLGLAEVARLLDVSEGTVRKQLARAKTKLRRALDG
jgi:RNA polymerase sigma factor (sigma-70 family)